MNYYELKQKQYSRSLWPTKPLTLEERMINAKKSVDYQKECELNDTVSEYLRALNLAYKQNFDPSLLSDSYSKSKIEQLEEETKAVKRMSPTEYFTKVAEKEEDCLATYVDEKSKLVAQQTKLVQKIESGKGFGNAVRKFFGNLDSYAESASRELETATEQLNNGIETLNAWGEIPSEDKLEYVVARFENERRTELDTAELDIYGIEAFKALKEQDAANAASQAEESMEQ